MKNYKRIAALCLAGMLAVSPLNVSAQQSGEEGIKTEQESPVKDEQNKETNTVVDDKAAGAGAEEQEKPAESGDKSGAEGSDGDKAALSEEQEKPADTGKEDKPENAPAQEKGEVTEPITKEDKPYLALGANLSEWQRDKVLELLGIKPEELTDYDVIYITNEEEYQYLGAYVSSDKIGKNSLSSVLVVKREKGNGINITTKNISYCTIGMYKNALITAGITDADIIVAGPSPISGTAALVGAMKAYSVMTGEDVSEQSMDAALNELVLTGELADTLGDSQKVEEFIAYLKQQIIENGLDTEEGIREAVDDACKEFDITLTEEEYGQIVELLQKIGDLDLDLDTIMNQAKDLYDRLAELDASTGFFGKIADFFQSILDFFKGLFGAVIW